jgi:hypothetical protein
MEFHVTKQYNGFDFFVFGFFFLKKKDVATFDRGKRWDDPSLPYRRTLVDELEKP